MAPLLTGQPGLIGAQPGCQRDLGEGAGAAQLGERQLGGELLDQAPVLPFPKPLADGPPELFGVFQVVFIEIDGVVVAHGARGIRFGVPSEKYVHPNIGLGEHISRKQPRFDACPPKLA
jgi:hypothetical protein